jgi:hypothetical protein
VENTLTFLNQNGDFQGGCFISGSAEAVSDWRLLPIILFVGLIVLFLKKPRKCILFFCAGIFLLFSDSAVADEAPEKSGNHLAGVAAGYYIPAESIFEDYYGENTFPVYGFYERFFSNYFSLAVESGYFQKKGHLLTESGGETKSRSEIAFIPVSSSLKVHFTIMPYIVGYVGAGGDYWYCREQNGDSQENWKNEEWVGGFHGKMGFRLYSTSERYRGVGAIVEGVYSQVDGLGKNETDIGGWSLRFGLFKQF